MTGHIARSRPLPKKNVRTSLPTSVIFVRQKHGGSLRADVSYFLCLRKIGDVCMQANMAAAKFRLQCADYNGCEGHLTGILPLFFLFKLFSMEIENIDKTRVKFLVEIKRKIFRFNSLSGHEGKS